jgi:hypothetical protein
VPDDAGHLRVGKLLRDRRADFRVGLIVFGDEHELRVLAVDLDLRRVGFFDRQPRAVLVDLAQVGDAAGQRPDVADLDFNGWGRRRRLVFDGRLLGFLLTATDQADGRGEQGERDPGIFHGISRKNRAK